VVRSERTEAASMLGSDEGVNASNDAGSNIDNMTVKV
jgi:hypothetical protein